jgi:hypothetical protein
MTRKEREGMRREDEEDRGGKPFSAFSRTPCGTEWASPGPNFRATARPTTCLFSRGDISANAMPRVCAVGRTARNHGPGSRGLVDSDQSGPLRIDGGRAAGCWRRHSKGACLTVIYVQRTRTRKAFRVREGRAKGRRRRSGTGK